jgi:hypothetical protein
MIGSPGMATGPRGIGLAVLLQTGLSGWLRAVSTSVGAAHPERPRVTGRPADSLRPSIAVVPGAGTALLLPPHQYTEATRLMASLVWSACAAPGPLRGGPPGDAR